MIYSSSHTNFSISDDLSSLSFDYGSEQPPRRQVMEYHRTEVVSTTYDPVLGRMLQVDNYVQNPFSSQSYNRYSYVLNNPLRYTDPSGEFPFLAVLVIGVISGAYTGGVLASGGDFNPGNWDSKAWNGAVIGGIIGGGIALGFSAALGQTLNIGGLSPGVSAGFHSSGITTTAWNISSNAFITGNINMGSRALQGGNINQVAASGLIGLGAGAIGGIYADKLTSGRTVMNFETIAKQNQLTSTINGAGDRLYKSIENGDPLGMSLLNSFYGGLEGYLFSKRINSQKLSRQYLKVNSFFGNSEIHARYLSSLASTGGTSVPGFGYLFLSVTSPFLDAHSFVVNKLSKASLALKIAGGIGAYTALDYTRSQYTGFLYFNGYDQLNDFNLPLQFTYPYWSKL